MRLLHYLKMTEAVLTNVEKRADRKSNINKLAFKIGSITPSLLPTTKEKSIRGKIKNMSKHITKAYSDDISISKSFHLGAVTHYISDFFCTTNNVKLNKQCKFKYTWKLYERLKEFNTNKLNDRELIVQWHDTLVGVREEVMGNDDTMDVKYHTQILESQILNINKIYFNKNIKNATKEKDVDKICENDLKYSISTGVSTILSILEPIRCISNNYKIPA